MRHSGHFDLESCAVLGVGIGEPGCVCATLLGNRVPRTFTYRTPFFAGKAAVAHCLVFLWWMPVLNLFLIVHIYRTAKHELHLECAKAECDIVRKESEICKTRYPILLVHGIFFRDWQLFNYWGRIPAELQKNGAVIFYGKQQSAQSISESARELAAQIKAICTETGAEKVNIIAHSKGGLDCRCAMQDYGVSQICSISDNDQHTPPWMRFCR